MAKSITAILIVFSLFSCSKETEVGLNESCSGEIDLETMTYPQKWVLVKMTGSMMNSVTTGSNMSWQEFIVLNPNGTFLKHREQNNQPQEETGSFSLALANDNSTIELTLTYPSDNNLVGSCYGLSEEKYLLTSRCKLVGTWNHCDGPGLEYERQ